MTDTSSPAVTTPPETSARSTPERNRLRPGDRAVHDWYRFVLSFPSHLVRATTSMRSASIRSSGYSIRSAAPGRRWSSARSSGPERRDRTQPDGRVGDPHQARLERRPRHACGPRQGGSRPSARSASASRNRRLRDGAPVPGERHPGRPPPDVASRQAEPSAEELDQPVAASQDAAVARHSRSAPSGRVLLPRATRGRSGARLGNRQPAFRSGSRRRANSGGPSRM